MPYLPIETKAALGLEWQGGDVPTASLPGELNFLFTVLIKKYLDTNGETYRTYNDIVGALECCKLELYRRKISWYEEKKIKENGDVF